jgi:hypothetical protein
MHILLLWLRDVGLAINPSVGSPEELLSLVRAKEVAQALLAAAVEKKRSTAPPEGAGVASPQPSAVGARAAPALPIVTDVQGGWQWLPHLWFLPSLAEGTSFPFKLWVQELT